MANLLQEQFINNHLVPGSIFEFGAGDCSWATRLARPVDTVDLYDRPDNLATNINYLKGNFLEVPLPQQQYDNIVCLSSLEHAGIETQHFADSEVNLNELYVVSNKLASLAHDETRLIITAPSGTNEIYGVKDGVSALMEKGQVFDWGFRTFTVSSMLALFPEFKLISAKAYLRYMDRDFFDSASWYEIDPLEINNQYKQQNGLLCVCLARNI